MDLNVSGICDTTCIDRDLRGVEKSFYLSKCSITQVHVKSTDPRYKISGVLTEFKYHFTQVFFNWAQSMETDKYGIFRIISRNV